MLDSHTPGGRLHVEVVTDTFRQKAQPAAAALRTRRQARRSRARSVPAAGLQRNRDTDTDPAPSGRPIPARWCVLGFRFRKDTQLRFGRGKRAWYERYHSSRVGVGHNLQSVISANAAI